MRTLRSVGIASALATGVALQACGGNVSPATVPALTTPARSNARIAVQPQTAQGLNKIRNIIMIIQENRSVDNLFQGFPTADTQSFGYDSQGKKVTLGPITMKTTS